MSRASTTEIRRLRKRVAELEQLLNALREAGPSPLIKKMFEIYGYEPTPPPLEPPEST